MPSLRSKKASPWKIIFIVIIKVFKVLHTIRCSIYAGCIFLQLRKKISTLEETNLANKPWQLMGEVSAMARPENSLLQEDLDFEHQTRLGMSVNIV